MIYYVEDDENIRELVVYTLNNTGFNARGFSNSTSFYDAFREQTPELVLLDIMLPEEDGISILKQIKSNAKTAVIPVIMVTAKSMEYDKVYGLDSGADDYISKPFGMMELVARVKARLRGATMNENLKPKILKEGGLVLNPGSHTVYVDDRKTALTLKEYELLKLLMGNKNTVFTREKLLDYIWDYSYDGGTRTVDVHIQTLRSKIGDAGKYIQTIRGVGYKFGADS